MKLQIVYPEDGWILTTLARYLIENIDGAVGSVGVPDVSRAWDITYYVNYYLFRPGRLQRIVPVAPATKKSLVSGAWFTHKDKYRFESKARILDFCVCPCTPTARHLERFNRHTFVAYHGIDTGRFTPKIRLGFVGRVRHDNRKGQDLFDTVRSLPFVELRVTGGSLPADEIPSFYQDIDYVFIPSITEGGPLCFQEGLASGKEILSTDVGMVHDFVGKEGIHIFDRSNPQTLIDLLQRLYEKRLKLRSIVEKYTIDFFVRRHLEIFEEMLEQKRRP